jgi:hypothetical protein
VLRQAGRREENRGAGLTVPDRADTKPAADLVIAGGLAFVSGLGPVDLANERVPLPEEGRSAGAEDLCKSRRAASAAGLARAILLSCAFISSISSG